MLAEMDWTGLKLGVEGGARRSDEHVAATCTRVSSRHRVRQWSEHEDDPNSVRLDFTDFKSAGAQSPRGAVEAALPKRA
jgi:hypothetical protein